MKPALACPGELMFDDIEIAIVDIDSSAIDGEPRAAVEHPAAPKRSQQSTTRPDKQLVTDTVDCSMVVDYRVDETGRRAVILS